MPNVSVIAPQHRDLVAPSALRELQGWLIWRYETQAGSDKQLKVPYYADGGRRFGTQGSADDRAKLTSFAAACTAAARKGFTGVGLAMLSDWGITALDFDKCAGADRRLPERRRLRRARRLRRRGRLVCLRALLGAWRRRQVQRAARLRRAQPWLRRRRLHVRAVLERRQRRALQRREHVQRPRCVRRRRRLRLQQRLDRIRLQRVRCELLWRCLRGLRDLRRGARRLRWLGHARRHGRVRVQRRLQRRGLLDPAAAAAAGGRRGRRRR